MENKIRQLTDKLYEEGLIKGKNEAEKLLSDAKAQADKIVADAQAQSDAILAKAASRDQELSQTTLKDVQIAAQRIIAQTKESVINTLSAVAVSGELQSEFSNSSFVGSLVSEIVENWSKQNPSAAITLTVPENKREEFDKFIAAKTFENLKAELTIKSDSRVLSGFRIASSDSGFYVSFSDEQFNNFFKEYLRERISEIVFVEK